MHICHSTNQENMSFSISFRCAVFAVLYWSYFGITYAGHYTVYSSGSTCLCQSCVGYHIGSDRICTRYALQCSEASSHMGRCHWSRRCYHGSKSPCWWCDGSHRWNSYFYNSLVNDDNLKNLSWLGLIISIVQHSCTCSNKNSLLFYDKEIEFQFQIF